MLLTRQYCRPLMRCSVRYIQHSSDAVYPVTVQPAMPNQYSQLPKAGYGLKKSSGKRLAFTQAQKEVMLEFYNRQAISKRKANPSEAVAVMVERGIQPLKESQIKSWWSTHNQRRKKEMERMSEQMQLLIHSQTQPPAVPAANALPTPGPATLQQGRATPSVTTAEPTNPLPASSGIHPVISIHGIAEYIFPETLSQSTINGRAGSNACVFIALCFGTLSKNYGLCCPPDSSQLPLVWRDTLVEAMEKGNAVHDELFDMSAVNVSVEEAVQLAGQEFDVLAIEQEFNGYGQNVLEQFTSIMQNIANQLNSFHVVVVTGKAMLILVSPDRSIICVDSHQHEHGGALVAVSKPGEFVSFCQWFSDMLMDNWGANLDVSLVSVSTVSYST